MRAHLVGLGHVVIDADLRQLIVIGLTRSAGTCRSGGNRSWRFERHRAAFIYVEIEQMCLSRSFHQPFPPRAEDIAAVELQLLAQLFDGSFVFLSGSVVELGSLIERGLKVLDLLGKSGQ